MPQAGSVMALPFFVYRSLKSLLLKDHNSIDLQMNSSKIRVSPMCVVDEETWRQRNLEFYNINTVGYIEVSAAHDRKRFALSFILPATRKNQFCYNCVNWKRNLKNN
jgi:hypothetical protein